MLYVFDYRKTHGGVWLPAPLAWMVVYFGRHFGRTLDYESYRPEPIGVKPSWLYDDDGQLITSS
jgi:hypothetical protein